MSRSKEGLLLIVSGRRKVNFCLLIYRCVRLVVGEDHEMKTDVAGLGLFVMLGYFAPRREKSIRNGMVLNY